MRTFEDFPVGMVLPLGSYEVTAEEVRAFAAEFDPQPFHLDEEAAKDSMLGGLSASGWHSCAMMMRLMCDAYMTGSASQGSPGVEFVRWKQPVRPGDVLSGRSEVVEARASASRAGIGIAKLATILVNANGETVLESQHTVLFLTRAGVAG